MTLPRLLWSSLLGGLVLILGCLVGLGPNQAIQLLFFSIVCTLEIGFVFWLGLALVIGLLILTLWDIIRGLHTPHYPDANGQATALIDYIQRRLEVGDNRAQMPPYLLRQGWAEADLEQAFQRIQGNPL